MNWMIKYPAIALGVLTLGGTVALAAEDATADMQQHQANMARGMSHEDAYSAQRRHATDDRRATAQSRKHAAVMSQGKGHEEARKLDALAAPATDDVGKANDRAGRHARIMQEGRGHEEAREASGTD